MPGARLTARRARRCRGSCSRTPSPTRRSGRPPRGRRQCVWTRRGPGGATVEEVRWELDVHGYPDVKIFLSGGLSREDVVAYRDVADAFGVGGAIANAPVIDFAMDIVEMEGRPYAKRGKRSGAKQVYEMPGRRVTLPLQAPAPEGGVPLLSRCIEGGAVVARPKMEDARERVLSRLSGLAREG